MFFSIWILVQGSLVGPVAKLLGNDWFGTGTATVFLLRRSCFRTRIDIFFKSLDNLLVHVRLAPTHLVSSFFSKAGEQLERSELGTLSVYAPFTFEPRFPAAQRRPHSTVFVRWLARLCRRFESFGGTSGSSRGLGRSDSIIVVKDNVQE